MSANTPDGDGADVATHRRSDTDDLTAATIRYAGTASRAWRNLETEVVIKARATLGWRKADPDERDDIDMAVSEACVWLRDTAIAEHSWDPEGGASLVGSAIRRAEYRHMHNRRIRRQKRHARNSVTYGDLEDFPCPTNVEGECVAAAMFEVFAADVGPATTKVALAHADGWSLAELAAATGVGVRGLSTSLWRTRNRWIESIWLNE